MTSERTAERELERVLTLLRNKIRERGFTQLEVQEALSWGRSYISQLLTKQKSLRVEQVLLILDVIGVEPAEFFGELYPMPAHHGGEYEPRMGRAPYNPSMLSDYHGGDDTGLQGGLDQLRDLVHGLVQLMSDKEILNLEELGEALRDTEGRSAIAQQLEGLRGEFE